MANPEHIAYLFQRVEEEISKLRSDLPGTLKLKETELTAEQRRERVGSHGDAFWQEEFPRMVTWAFGP